MEPLLRGSPQINARRSARGDHDGRVVTFFPPPCVGLPEDAGAILVPKPLPYRFFAESPKARPVSSGKVLLLKDPG